MNPLLLLLLFPLFASFFVLLLTKIEPLNLKRMVLGLSILPLLWTIFHAIPWQSDSYSVSWFHPLSIDLLLKVDFISYLFICLCTLIVPIALLTTPATIKQASFFYALVFLLEALLIGLFLSRDVAFFTFFWEATLIPLFFLSYYWGHEDRKRAAIKFILYLIAGSTFMIAALLFLYFGNPSPTFNLDQLQSTAEAIPNAKWICLIFLLAFAVKTPLFPFHAWLPDAYYEASTPATILLSALLSKAGIYGLLRISFPLFPNLMAEWSPYLLMIAIFGVLYGAFAAWSQTDYKRLIAYSSFSHVNFILAGLFVGTAVAYQGAVLQAINHGITISGLFLTAGWLEKRTTTTDMRLFSGAASYFPKLCWLTFIFVLSSVALPGTNSFVGELLIFYGLIGKSFWLTLFLGLSIIFSVLYMLKWMQTSYFGPPSPIIQGSLDIRGREILQALPLVLLVFWIGLYPAFILNHLTAPADITPKTSNERLEQIQ